MSKGVVMFCYDSEISYSKMCNFNVGLIKNKMGLPVTVYTDRNTAGNLHDVTKIITDRPEGNSRHFKSIEKTFPWYNANRADALRNPPYEENLLVDVDMFLYTDNLKQCFGSQYDFLCFKKSMDLSGNYDAHEEKIGCTDIDFCWATVLYFKKSKWSRSLGDVMLYIKKNYQYFRELYRVPENNFRNDICLSIALNQLKGFTEMDCFMPGHINVVNDNVEVQLGEHGVKIFDHDNKDQYLTTSDIDVHVLSKDIKYA